MNGLNRRALLAGAMLAGTSIRAFAQAQSPTSRLRVVVVYVPDRPIKYWRDGMAVVVQPSAFPGLSSLGYISLPGVDWARIIVDSYVTALNAKYPQIEFVPSHSFAERAAPVSEANTNGASDARVNIDAIWPRNRDGESDLRMAMNETQADAVMTLAALDELDYKRSLKYGGLRLELFPLYSGLLIPEIAKWKAVLSWGVTASITYRDEGYYAGQARFSSRGLKALPKDALSRVEFLDTLEGRTDTAVVSMLTEQREKLLACFVASGQITASGMGMRTMDDALYIERERRPRMYGLPFGG